MQSSYALLMCHYRLRAAIESKNIGSYYYMLKDPDENSEIQDVERLLREIRQALESIIGAMSAAGMFEGVGGMNQEIQIAYQSAVIGN